MKIKKGLEISSSDFWYDLCEGYLKPEEILEDTDHDFIIDKIESEDKEDK